MRAPRYRFSEDVRSTTRAIALRMVHAGAVAASPEELETWISGTADIRERLTKGGYGSAFSAVDLFPLFESFVAKATAARQEVPSKSRSMRWIGVLVALIAIAILVVVRFIS